MKDENYTCTTPKLTNVDNYKRNADGDVEAQLNLTYKLNGKNLTAFPFRIFFELAPTIEYVSIEGIEDESPYQSYSAHYKVKYKGADKIYVYVEEEFGTDVRMSVINEPYIAKGCAKHIKSLFYAWIDFEVENKYGKRVYTVELQPHGIVSKKSKNNSSGIKGIRNLNIEADDIGVTERIEVYDATGRLITYIKDLSDIETLENNGLFIIRTVMKNGDTKTLKYMK